MPKERNWPKSHQIPKFWNVAWYMIYMVASQGLTNRTKQKWLAPPCHGRVLFALQTMRHFRVIYGRRFNSLVHLVRFLRYLASWRRLTEGTIRQTDLRSLDKISRTRLICSPHFRPERSTNRRAPSTNLPSLSKLSSAITAKATFNLKLPSFFLPHSLQ